MKIPPFAAVAFILLAAPSATGAFSSGTYVADWSGVTFTERTDPIERFSHFPLSDDDGDGFAYVPPVPLPAEPQVEVITLRPEHNKIVSTELSRAGLSSADAARSLALFAAQNALVIEELPLILDAIVADDFAAAAALGLGTGLEIRYYCGTPDVIRSFGWILGVPLAADCNGDLIPDLAFNGAPLLAVPRVPSHPTDHPSGFSTMWLDITVETLNPYYTNRVSAFSYQSHILTIETRPQTLMEARLMLSGLQTPSVEISATLYAPYRLHQNDAISYTNGDTPMTGTTVWMDLAADVANVQFDVNVRTADGFSADIDLANVAQFSQIRANIVVSEGRAIPVHAKGFPSNFRVGYRDLWGPGGSYYHIDLSSASGAMPSLEIAGTYYQGSVAEFGFQLIGFPQFNSLRISPGGPSLGCSGSSANVFSIDLSKLYAASPGRYRAIAATGYVCDKAISVTGSNLVRANIVFSKQDRWDADLFNAMLMTGASANVAFNSFLDIDSDVPWLPDVTSRLEYLDAGRAQWQKTVGSSHASGPLSIGDAGQMSDGLAVNAYYWNVADAQLPQSICYFRYFDGTCA